MFVKIKYTFVGRNHTHGVLTRGSFFLRHLVHKLYCSLLRRISFARDFLPPSSPHTHAHPTQARYLVFWPRFWPPCVLTRASARNETNNAACARPLIYTLVRKLGPIINARHPPTHGPQQFTSPATTRFGCVRTCALPIQTGVEYSLPMRELYV